MEIKPEFTIGFWEGESMGVMPPKRCGRCMQCSECTDSALIHSRKEQDELELLRKAITRDFVNVGPIGLILYQRGSEIKKI